MKAISAAALVLGGVLLYAVTALCQPGNSHRPPDERQPPPGERPGGPPDGPPEGHRPFGPPPPFEPGRLLPPHIRDGLDLTDEQEDQLDKLEKEVKDRLLKILTAEQKKKLKELRRRPPFPPPGGHGRAHGQERRPSPADAGRPGNEGGRRSPRPERGPGPQEPGRPRPAEDEEIKDNAGGARW